MAVCPAGTMLYGAIICARDCLKIPENFTSLPS